VDSVNALVEMPIWDALAYEQKPVASWVVVAVDASRTNDCTALCVVCRIGNLTYILETWIWTPDTAHEMDYQQTVVPAIEHIMQRYQVARVVYDPWQLADTMLQMSKTHRRIPFLPFDQGQARVEADTAFVTKINQGRIRHDGDPTLREHIQNADGKEYGDKDALRIVKRESIKKIDAAVAASMAVQAAEEVAGTYKPPAKIRAKLTSTGKW
jgi:phage terminase large subunit-like protein